MTTVYCQKVLIHRDTVTKVNKTVWPWEVPVLHEQFGEGKVQDLGFVEVEREELPDADIEFARLAGQYGKDSETNVVLVEQAYGRGKAGIKELEKAIKASTRKPGGKAADSEKDSDEAPAEKPAKPKPKKKASKKKSASKKKQAKAPEPKPDQDGTEGSGDDPFKI